MRGRAEREYAPLSKGGVGCEDVKVTLARCVCTERVCVCSPGKHSPAVPVAEGAET